jgi:hypothetical protein
MVNVLFGGLPTKRSQNLTLREVLNIEPAIPTPLRWSEVPITFSRADQWTSSPSPETNSRGLQTQQGTIRQWERTQRPLHQDLEVNEAQHHRHAHQEPARGGVVDNEPTRGGVVDNEPARGGEVVDEWRDEPRDETRDVPRHPDARRRRSSRRGAYARRRSRRRACARWRSRRQAARRAA